VVTAVLGGPLVSLVAGPAYAATAPLVWRFTLLGVCLALVQVIAYAGLAAASHRMGVAMWLAGALAVAATTLHHDDVAAVVDAVLLTAIALVVVGAAIEWRWIRAVPREDVAGAAGRDGVGARVGAAPGVGVGGAPAAGVSGRRRARSGRPRR
jgi:hypothetical protein